jgi:hypothetical protein
MRFPRLSWRAFAHLLPRNNAEEFTDDLWKWLLVFKLSFAGGCCVWQRLEIKRFYLKIISEADGCHYEGKLLLTLQRKIGE